MPKASPFWRNFLWHGQKRPKNRNLLRKLIEVFGFLFLIRKLGRELRVVFGFFFPQLPFLIGPEKNGYGGLLERETQSEETKIYPRI